MSNLGVRCLAGIAPRSWLYFGVFGASIQDGEHAAFGGAPKPSAVERCAATEGVSLCLRLTSCDFINYEFRLSLEVHKCSQLLTAFIAFFMFREFVFIFRFFNLLLVNLLELLTFLLYIHFLNFGNYMSVIQWRCFLQTVGAPAATGGLNTMRNVNI